MRRRVARPGVSPARKPRRPAGRSPIASEIRSATTAARSCPDPVSGDHERFSGESTYSLWKSIAVWGKHITGFSILPLRIASFLGVLASLFGLLLGLYYIAYYFLHGTVQGWTTLTCLILFMGGLILTSLGVIGEYVGRIYLKLNNRPQYVIKDIIRSS